MLGKKSFGKPETMRRNATTSALMARPIQTRAVVGLLPSTVVSPVFMLDFFLFG